MIADTAAEEGVHAVNVRAGQNFGEAQPLLVPGRASSALKKINHYPLIQSIVIKRSSGSCSSSEDFVVALKITKIVFEPAIVNITPSSARRIISVR